MIDNAILLKNTKLKGTDFLDNLEKIPLTIQENNLDLIKSEGYLTVTSIGDTLKDWYLNWLQLNPGERIDRVLLLDTETTHLNGFACSIALIEYSMEDKVIVDKYYSVINPLVPIDPESSAIHGLYQKDVENAPTFADIFTEIEAFLLRTDMSIAFNAIYDIGVLIREYERLNKIPPIFNYMDVMRRLKVEVDAKNSLGRKKDPKLSEAAKYFNVIYDESTLHNALYDTEILTNTFHAALIKYGS